MSRHHPWTETALELITSRRLLGVNATQITRMLRQRGYRLPNGQLWTYTDVRDLLADVGLWQASRRFKVIRHGKRYRVRMWARTWSWPERYGYFAPLPETDGQTAGRGWIVDSAGLHHPQYTAPIHLTIAVLKTPIPTEKDRPPRGPELGSRATLDQPVEAPGQPSVEAISVRQSLNETQRLGSRGHPRKENYAPHPPGARRRRVP